MAHKKVIRSFSRLSELGNLFWERFYLKLKKKKPDVLKYFKNTDMHHLYTMLSQSVTYIVLNSSSESVQSTVYFRKVIFIHNEYLRIPKSYIQEWKLCLLESIKELDLQLTEDEYEIWKETIDIIIEPIGVDIE